MNDDLPPPLPGYHRDPAPSSVDDGQYHTYEVPNRVVAMAVVLLLLFGAVALPLIIMLWKVAL